MPCGPLNHWGPRPSWAGLLACIVLGLSAPGASLGVAPGATPGETAQRDCEIAPPPPPAAPQLAVSLSRFQRDLRRCQETRWCTLDLSTLYGLTRVDGFLVDAANQDLVLFGELAPEAPPLHADDLVVALRNATHGYLEDGPGNVKLYHPPGVSIDGTPAALAEITRIGRQLGDGGSASERDALLAEWLQVCETPQPVRVFGVPRASRFARVMLDADYRMKRFVDGTGGEPVAGLTGLVARHVQLVLAADQGTLDAGNNQGGLNRFWFYPGEHAYSRVGDLVRLERADVILLDQAEHVSRGGQVSSAPDPDPLARAFACEFSQRFREVAAKRPLYQELEGLFRWMALVRLMLDQGAIDGPAGSGRSGLDLDFLLSGYRLPGMGPVEDSVPGIGRVAAVEREVQDGNQRRRLELHVPSCGGVSIDYDDQLQAAPADSASLQALRQQLLDQRPPRRASWDLAAALPAAPPAGLDVPGLLDADALD